MPHLGVERNPSIPGSKDTFQKNERTKPQKCFSSWTSIIQWKHPLLETLLWYIGRKNMLHFKWVCVYPIGSLLESKQVATVDNTEPQKRLQLAPALCYRGRPVMEPHIFQQGIRLCVTVVTDLSLSHTYHAVLTALLCLSAIYKAYAAIAVSCFPTSSVRPPRHTATAISTRHLFVRLP